MGSQKPLEFFDGANDAVPLAEFLAGLFEYLLLTGQYPQGAFQFYEKNNRHFVKLVPNDQIGKSRRIDIFLKAQALTPSPPEDGPRVDAPKIKNAGVLKDGKKSFARAK